MELTRLMTLLSIPVHIFYCCCTIVFCTAINTITSTQPINDPEAIVSNGATFKLGFFSPVNSTYRYVGIWYNQISVKAVVWVANRDKPLNDSYGTLTISKDGNLVVLDRQKQIVWSSDVPNSSVNSTAQLSDSGNLILRDESNGNIIWESFDHPSDSMLQEMKISSNRFTDKKTQLKSPSDPSTGKFTSGINPLNIPEIYIWNGSHPYWRSGPWNGQSFIGIPAMVPVYNKIYEFVDDKKGNVILSYNYVNESSLSYHSLCSDGTLGRKEKIKGKETWENTCSVLNTECDIYGKCGPFGSCNVKGSPICTCLQGFDPNDKEEWSRGNWTSGCVRRRQLQCERNNTGGGKGKEDGFLKLMTVKVPAFAELVFDAEDNCKSQCLNNCSCIAYAYCSGIGCMQWSGDLIDIQKFSYGGADLYIRIAYSELEKNRSTKVVIKIAVLVGSVTIAICTYFLWRRMARPGGRKKESEMSLPKKRKVNPYCLNESLHGDNVNKIKLEELSIFSFEMLEIATNKFDVANKLGQGGFGPVYKGKLQSGQEVAIKRLSRSSGQGHEEFMNEVVVISELQHRNLVRLLGCCVEGEEKMLIYEYMPNKSLDGFLFDPIKQKLLDWRKRANIIEGIGRGLLYLHRDSRLRIIHRDLKTGNVLLDEDLNPKISDFGMAKIFGGNQKQANTRRIVGTYGYMAPEYAMHGRFSKKSDIFSFGVLLLEIVSGRKNTSFYKDEHSLTLLGFAWKLWNEDRIELLIDPTISDPCFQVEILRYAHVGLLCVQDFATNRPTISTVLSMLSSEIANLPTPTQPAFTDILGLSNKRSSQLTRRRRFSANNVTLTTIDGR
ncbi:G-type lectin S-receptor-like serine/threonine-protein kinase At1g11330 [Cornus florida]|uniref:G-type lectin S-receptor-like serine/threonine-protein kinase At1g11330 n=1 Tax=Cornus florida TaxID=4283 RepID=UPI0028A03FEF|nr:G-type lectin S-receptor-like serine/threonine-protein kinase At1g11330 [Cornus florida]